jgi:hypothetical protein
MTPQHNSFTSFLLTQDEIKAGSNFLPEQRAVIQNIISQLAEEKISLKYDPTAPEVFLQREAELAGQIGILKYLLNLSTTE